MSPAVTIMASSSCHRGLAGRVHRACRAALLVGARVVLPLFFLCAVAQDQAAHAVSVQEVALHEDCATLCRTGQPCTPKCASLKCALPTACSPTPAPAPAPAARQHGQQRIPVEMRDDPAVHDKFVGSPLALNQTMGHKTPVLGLRPRKRREDPFRNTRENGEVPFLDIEDASVEGEDQASRGPSWAARTRRASCRVEGCNSCISACRCGNSCTSSSCNACLGGGGGGGCAQSYGTCTTTSGRCSHTGCGSSGCGCPSGYTKGTHRISSGDLLFLHEGRGWLRSELWYVHNNFRQMQPHRLRQQWLRVSLRIHKGYAQNLIGDLLFLHEGHKRHWLLQLEQPVHHQCLQGRELLQLEGGALCVHLVLWCW